MSTEDAGQACQAKYEARQKRAEQAVASLPPEGRWLLERWRSVIERAGRQGPTGCCCDAIRLFAEDLRRAMTPAEQPAAAEGKHLDLSERGPGW